MTNFLNLIRDIVKRNIILLVLLPVAMITSIVVYAVQDTKNPAAPNVASTPSLWQDCAGYVALTYDDGPVDQTPALLKTLRTSQVRATFFVLGAEVENHPETLKAVQVDRHSIGNHSRTHPDLSTLSPLDLRAQLTATSEAVTRVTGTAPILFRPPQGLTNGQIRELVTSLGMLEVIWNVDTFDWKGNDVAQMRKTVENIKDGDIILMHDSGQHTLAFQEPLFETMKQKKLCPGQIVRSVTPVRAFGDVIYYAKAVQW